MKSTAASWQQQTYHLTGHLEKGHFNRKQSWVLNQRIFSFVFFTQKTVSRFILNHSDPSGTCRDHSCFDVTYGNKRADGWEHATDSQRHPSFSISPRKNQLLPRLGNGWETLQMRSLCWQPNFTAGTCTVMTNISAWEEGEKCTCAA